MCTKSLSKLFLYPLILATILSISVPLYAHIPACKIGDRHIMGYLETVTRLDNQFDTRLEALIDSGCTTSSMDASNIRIEQLNNGSQWVRFDVITDPDSDKKVTLLKPVKRYIRVITHKGPPQRRPVIETNIALGNVKITTEVSLTSRSKFPQSILLGRNSLKELAVIDTSQTYLLDKCRPHENIDFAH